MAISHNLNSNCYLINNEIWMKLESSSPIGYFTVYVNWFFGSSTKFIFYPDENRSAIFNLQQVVKSLMPPNDGQYSSNGWMNFINMSITVGSDLEFTSFTITKCFIRGGNRTNDTNQTQSPNINLRISERLPVWSGYPISDEYTEEYVVKSRSVSLAEKVDYRRIKGCNNYYLKFSNQKGGYSYWLFESFSEKESAASLGFNAYPEGGLINLGSETKYDFRLYSKIPSEYVNYAKDMIVSCGIYLYDENTASWKTAFMKSNSIEYDNIKKVYAVTISLELHYRFNPSLLWTN